MRPIKLTLSAFGPYIYEEIDLGKLGKQGIYLITGDTGAGKTSIFDGITYALYGKASGEIRDPSMFRCKYATPDQETYVELEFEYQGEVYTINRRPEYFVPKSNNPEKLSKKKAMVSLKNSERLLGDKIVLVNAAVEDIMGVTYGQFTQIAMIAQGEFQKLLHASTEERAGIFRKIFQTYNYQTLQIRLQADTKKVGEEKERLELGIQQYLDGIQGIELREGPTKEKLAWITEQLEIHTQEEQNLNEALETVDKRRTQVSADLSLAKDKKKQEEKLEEAKELEKDKKNTLEQAKSLYEQEVDKKKERETLATEIAFLIEKQKSYEELETLEKEEAANKEYKKNQSEEVERLKNNRELCKAKETELKAELQLLAYIERDYQAVKSQCGQWESHLTTQEQLETDTKDFLRLQAGLKEQIGILEIDCEKYDKKKKEYDLVLDYLANIDVQEVQFIQKVKDQKHIIANGQKLEKQFLEMITKQGELESKQIELKKLLDYAQALQLQYMDANRNYLEEQAGILADGLQEGEACPVCGAVHHLQLAQRTEGAITKEALEELRTSVEAAEKASGESSQAMAGKQAEYKGLIEKAEDLAKDLWTEEVIASLFYAETLDIGRNQEHLEEFLVQATEQLEELEAKEAEAKSHKKEADEVKRVYPQLEMNIRETNEKLIAKRTELISVNEKVTNAIESAKKHQTIVRNELQAEANLSSEETIDAANQASEETKDAVKLIPEESIEHVLTHLTKAFRGIHAAFIEKSTALAAKAERRRNLEDKEIPNNQASQKSLDTEINQKLIEINSLKTKLEFQQVTWSELKSKLGDKTKQEAEEFIIQEQGRLKQLEKALEETERIYRQEKQGIDELKGTMEALEESIKAMNQLDVEALMAESETLDARRNELQEQYKVRYAQNQSNAENLRNLVEKSADLLKVEEQYNWMKLLSDTANGRIREKEKIMLESFIQMEYFDRIIRRANVRLMKMTSQQYELKRQEELGTSNGKKGLDLNVIDHYNSSQRSVKTLSGGESFKASLALALGLADEIQSVAGGIQLDTMFVDEGFGSLDDESLQQAIKILMDLGEGNRLVGIISHVDELKEKIDKQLIIQKHGVEGSKHTLCIN